MSKDKRQSKAARGEDPVYCATDCANKDMYSRSRNQGRWGQVWSGLTGRSRHLLALAQVENTCTVDASRYVGMQTVAINRIQGSQERGCDFDREFNPLQDHNEERWLGIARARRLGKALPPVDLIQVGDVYFVWDGHHRVSVARALGQLSIEARVTVWQVSGVLPWERAVHTSSPAAQEMGIRQRFRQAKDDSIRFRERFLSKFREVLGGMELGLRVRLRGQI